MLPSDDENHDARRAKLNELHRANVTTQVEAGTGSREQLLLGYFYDRRACGKLRSRLSALGIHTTSQLAQNRLALYVHPRHREQAFDVLEDHRQSFPDRKPKGLGRAYDLAILMTAVSFFICVLHGVATGTVMLPLAFFFSVTSIGWFLARWRRNRLLYGSSQFTTYELLLTIGVLACLLALWRIAIWGV